jgi:type II secretory pathway pseudopilin PulG
VIHSKAHRRRSSAAGFTLVEALVSITITAIAGSALLLGINSALQTTNSVLEQTIAQGMAQQLMDELSGLRYVEAGSSPYAALRAETGEVSGASRERFDDIDDFSGLQIQAPKDLWGIALGQDDGKGGLRHTSFRAPTGYFSRWRQEVEVYYVSDADMSTRLASGQTSNYRAVHVRIFVDTPDRGAQKLVDLRRIFANVPS